MENKIITILQKSNIQFIIPKNIYNFKNLNILIDLQSYPIDLIKKVFNIKKIQTNKNYYFLYENIQVNIINCKQSNNFIEFYYSYGNIGYLLKKIFDKMNLDLNENGLFYNKFQISSSKNDILIFLQLNPISSFKNNLDFITWITKTPFLCTLTPEDTIQSDACKLIYELYQT